MCAAFAAATLVSSAALAQISDDMVKIGVLTDMNGPASTPTGQGSVTAAQMAVDDFGGKRFTLRATELSGYDTSLAGQIRFAA